MRKDKKEYKIELDYLRLLACYLVIVSHLDCMVVFELDYAQWDMANIIYATRNACVPIFFVLTGILVLRYPNDLRKSIKKALRLLASWAITAAFFSCLKMYQGDTGISVYRVIVDSIANPNAHLWFLPVMIGIYLLIPVISQICKEEKIIKYYLILWAGVFILKDTMVSMATFTGKIFHFNYEVLIKLFETFSISDVYSYTGYVVLGYYLYYIFEKKIHISVLISGLLLSIIIPCWLNCKSVAMLGERLINVWQYTSVWAVVETCCITLIFKDYVSKWKCKNETVRRMIRYASASTFFVYLIHPAFTGRLYEKMNSGNIAITIPVLGLCVMLICILMKCLIDVVFHKIAAFRKN